MSGNAQLGQSPDNLTAHLAGGEHLEPQKFEWVDRNLTQLRQLVPGDYRPAGDLSLPGLKRTYTIARVLQGGVVASRLALPTTIEAGQMVRDASFPEKLDDFARRPAAQTERFLSGSENGVPRQSNDYPQTIKHYISALAGILEVPYQRAYRELEDKSPELLKVGQDADELQRLCWGHMRWIIDKVMPAEEVASYRKKPLREGTNELMTVIRERTDVSLPVRVMQRDDWRDALANPRQAPEVALFNSMKFFVENAEIALSYSVGSLIARTALADSPETALRGHIRFGAEEIASGARTFTHSARFQSRVGARPNDYRSFNQFLRNVTAHMTGTTLGPDGSLAWAQDLQELGYCPARNKFKPRNPNNLTDFAAQGHAAIVDWKEYGRVKFGVEPLFEASSPAELLGAAVAFSTVHEGSPLRPGSDLVQDLASRIL